MGYCGSVAWCGGSGWSGQGWRGWPPSRRGVLAGGLATSLLAGCASVPGRPARRRSAAAPDGGAAVLDAVPPGPGAPPPSPGERPLGVAPVRDALLLVPPGLPAEEPVPLVLALHGAGGDAAGGLAPLRPLAQEHGLVLLAPASRGSTWDAVGGRFGPDADLVDEALARVFATVPVDPARVAVAGFSDGASYALGLGLANGGLLRRVLAFSPGFVPPGPRTGRPAVFVSHGVRDDVLPIGRTSRRLVPLLRAEGYGVEYQEFDGPHAVPPEVARSAVTWLVRSWAP